MKILLFGKSGQVGWELQRSLSPLGEIIAPGRGDQALCGDLEDLEGIARTVASVRPDVVVNAAAHTAVDKAEAEADLAHRINALAVGAIGQAARACGAWVVHYSTDYVFDGSGVKPWSEDDAPSPLNVYGRSKLEGERLLASACPRHLVLRTSWVYAARGSNFLKSMLRLARERDRLDVIDDQFGAPTGADLIADVTAHAIRTLHARPELAGTYHLAAAGETTWHGYAALVLDEARQRGADLRLTGQPTKVSSAQFPTVARRPSNSRLNTARLQDRFSLSLPQWQAGVIRTLSEIVQP